MKLLLDTHVFLWSVDSPERLTAAAVTALKDPANAVFVSVTSAWEIAIKQSVGKLTLARPAEQWVPDRIQRAGFEVTPVSLAAALRVRSLPHHHRDPFDRMLIAQALEDGYTIVTRDNAFAAYGVPILAA